MMIQLSDHFDYRRLLRFVFPSIIMMVFTSIYGVVDGLFVSNFVGKTSFAAVNLVMPFIMILGGVGFMLGTGGSALVAKTLGEGQSKKSQPLLYYDGLSDPASRRAALRHRHCVYASHFHFIGRNRPMLTECVIYGRTVLFFNTAFMLQNVFRVFSSPQKNQSLDCGLPWLPAFPTWFWTPCLSQAFTGALPARPFATGLSQCVGGVLPLLYFLRPNKSLLRLTKTKLEGIVLLKACFNGSSELMSNISMSLVSMLYNFQLIRFSGENGVAAYGVLMYVQFVFVAVFIGYAIGSAPIIGYHYGAGNHAELKNMLRKKYGSHACGRPDHDDSGRSTGPASCRSFCRL